MNAVEWMDLKHVLRQAKFHKKTQYVKIIHKMWATNVRQFRWKQAESPKCPICKTDNETRLHLLTCSNVVTKSHRKILLTKMKKELRRIQTAPLLTNHIMRALHQFHNNFPVSMVPVNTTTDEIEKSHLISINNQMTLGVDNLLSGALTTFLSDIQRHHIKTYNVGKFTSIRSWNRNIIKLMLDHANELWQFRSKILHDEALLTREAFLRNQAVDIHISYKATPYKVAYEQRHLLDRTTTYLRSTHLRNVRSWLNRINLAIEEEANRVKNGRSDIRNWMSKKKQNNLTDVEVVDSVETAILCTETNSPIPLPLTHVPN